MIVREGAIDADDAAIRAVLKAISGKPDRPACAGARKATAGPRPTQGG
jgi:hypothetical protein